jgi:ligand-binding sensor domain-containing protein
MINYSVIKKTDNHSQSMPGKRAHAALPLFKKLWIYIVIVTFCVSPLRASAGQFKKPLTIRQFTTKQGLSSEMVNTIAFSGNKVWFGTYGGGATVFDRSRNSWKAYTTKGEPPAKADDGDSITWKNLLSYNHVSVIVPDSNCLWFGTYFYGFGGGGISSFQLDRESWRSVNTNGDRAKKVVSIAPDGDNLWVGSEKGLSLLDKQSGRWKRFCSMQEGLPGNFVNAVLAEPDCIWLGTNEGIGRLDKSKGTWQIYTKVKGMPQKEIKALARVGDSIWAGRADGILFSYDSRTDCWKKIFPKDKLAQGGILSITVSKKRVMVCRDNGVSIMDRTTGQWDSLTKADGLLSDNVFCAAEDRNSIWFGTDNGVSRLILAP